MNDPNEGTTLKRFLYGNNDDRELKEQRKSISQPLQEISRRH